MCSWESGGSGVKARRRCQGTRRLSRNTQQILPNQTYFRLSQTRIHRCKAAPLQTVWDRNRKHFWDDLQLQVSKQHSEEAPCTSACQRPGAKTDTAVPAAKFARTRPCDLKEQTLWSWRTMQLRTWCSPSQMFCQRAVEPGRTSKAQATSIACTKATAWG